MFFLEKAASGTFVAEISQVLSALPRQVLLILKTNDLLRSVDQALGVGGPNCTSNDHLLRVINTTGIYCSYIIRKEKSLELSSRKGLFMMLFSGEFYKMWFDYWKVAFKMFLLEAYLNFKA